MACRPKFGSKKREALWAREVHKAYVESDGRLRTPVCNLCGLPVDENEPWHESHCPSRAKSFGGKSVGVAHAPCNLKHGCEVVTPMFAKSNRIRARHLGLKRPGQGRHPMPAGRDTKISRTVSGRVVSRLSLSEKIARMRAKRAIGDEETTEANPRPSIARLPNFPFEETRHDLSRG
jgi:hypothetical protein